MSKIELKETFATAMINFKTVTYQIVNLVGSPGTFAPLIDNMFVDKGTKPRSCLAAPTITSKEHPLVCLRRIVLELEGRDAQESGGAHRIGLHGMVCVTSSRALRTKTPTVDVLDTWTSPYSRSATGTNVTMVTLADPV